MGLPESVLSKLSGSPPKTTQDRAQTKGARPVPGEIKISDPVEKPTRGVQVWKVETPLTTPQQRTSLNKIIFVFNFMNKLSSQFSIMWPFSLTTHGYIVT